MKKSIIILIIFCFQYLLPGGVSAAIVQLDTAFNGVGYTVHNGAAGGNSNDRGYAIAIQEDGKYVIAGQSTNATGNYDLALWRYNPNGALDTTFNGTGYATHNGAAGGNSHDLGYSITIDSNNRYVVTGSSTNISGNSDLAVWRYNNDGSIDTTFNGTGYAIHNGAAGGIGTDLGYSIKNQDGGKYVISGISKGASGGDDLAIWRYKTDGSLDATFNGVGYVTHNSAAGGNGTDTGRFITIEQNGRYVVCGGSSNITATSDLVIWRYNTDGTLDTTFNGVGYIIHDSAAGGNSFDLGYSIILQSDGKYVTSGYSRNASGNEDLAVWRFENLYQVDQLDTDLDAEVINTNIETGTSNGMYGTQTVRLKKDSYPIADVISNLIEDLNWSSVTADYSLNEYKSFVHGLDGAEGVSSTFSLYIPYKEGDEGVGICPDVSSLESINSSCEGVEYRTAILVNINGILFWKVDNVSGTGGFSVTELPETGQKIWLSVALGGIVTFLTLWTTLTIFIYRKRKARSYLQAI